MNCIHFGIRISKEEYLSYYSGHAKSISVNAYNGQRIQFPAEHMRQFVTHDGIDGEFEICFDGNNRLKTIRKLNSHT